MNNNWRRCNTATPCPCCGNNSGCSISLDGSAAMCLRATEGFREMPSGMGWLIRLGKADPTKSRKLEKQKDAHLTTAECKAMQEKFATAFDPEKLADLATKLGLSVDVLKKYGVGRDGKFWTFPMYGGNQKIVGFRTRDADGVKRCIPGSRNGLFIPADYNPAAIPIGVCDSVFSTILVLPEGPTDAAAASMLGFRAIGRPNNMGGADQLIELLRSGDRQDVVIVADHDPVKRMPDGTPFVPGWEGALYVAEKIMPVCGTLKVLRPPGEQKDLRKWMTDGGRGEVLIALYENTETMTAKLLREKQRKLDIWKKSIKSQIQKAAV